MSLLNILANPATRVIVPIFSFFAYQGVKTMYGLAREYLLPEQGESSTHLYSAYASIQDLLSSILYSSGAYDLTSGDNSLQSGTFNILNQNFLGNVGSEDGERYKALQSASNHLVAGTVYSGTLVLYDWSINGRDPTYYDYYRIVKPIIKQGSTLVCKAYMNPLSFTDIFMGWSILGITGPSFLYNSFCNAVGEITEGSAYMLYTSLFSEETSVYYPSEMVADVIFGAHKVLHSKVEKHFGHKLAALAIYTDESGTLEKILKHNMPIHHWIGGYMRKVFAKIYLNSAEEFISNLAEKKETALVPLTNLTKPIQEGIGWLVIYKENDENQTNTIAVQGITRNKTIEFSKKFWEVLFSIPTPANLNIHPHPYSDGCDGDMCTDEPAPVTLLDVPVGCFDNGYKCQVTMLRPDQSLLQGGSYTDVDDLLGIQQAPIESF